MSESLSIVTGLKIANFCFSGLELFLKLITHEGVASNQNRVIGFYVLIAEQCDNVKSMTTFKRIITDVYKRQA